MGIVIESHCLVPFAEEIPSPPYTKWRNPEATSGFF